MNRQLLIVSMFVLLGACSLFDYATASELNVRNFTPNSQDNGTYIECQSCNLRSEGKESRYPIWTAISTIVHNFGLGLGTLFLGISALGYTTGYFEKLVRKWRARKYKRLYPKELKDKENGWELTHNPQRHWHLYLIDHRSKSRHWIANWETFKDLFTAPPAPGDQRKDNLFNNYTENDPIITNGTPEP